MRKTFTKTQSKLTNTPITVIGVFCLANELWCTPHFSNANTIRPCAKASRLWALYQMFGCRKFRRNEQRLCFVVIASGFYVIWDERHCFSKHTKTVIKCLLGHAAAFIRAIKVSSRRLPQTPKISRPCARDGVTAVCRDGGVICV